MAIVIDLSIEKLEFEIAGKVFLVHKTDELIEEADKLSEEIISLGKESESAQTGEKEERKTLVDYRSTIEKGLNLILGEGAFEYIEEKVGKQYTPKMSEIFFIVYEELQSGIQEDVMPEKYKKNKRDKKK